MKNKCKSCGRSKSRTFTARNELNRLAIVGGSNNVGVWGQSPQLPEANGDSGAVLPTLR